MKMIGPEFLLGQVTHGNKGAWIISFVHITT